MAGRSLTGRLRFRTIGDLVKDWVGRPLTSRPSAGRLLASRLIIR